MKNRYAITRLSKRKKISFLILGFLLVVGIGLWHFHPWQKSAIEIAREKGNVSGQLDRQNAQKNKKSSSSSSGGNNATETSGSDQNLQSVTPILSRWDGGTDPVEVAGYVQGVFEDGGTCTYTFTKDSQSFSRTSVGFQDATHTSCAPVDISKSSFPQTGTWQVTLKYKSSTSVGTSNSQSFDIK